MREILRLLLVFTIFFTITCEKKDESVDHGLDCDLLKNGIIYHDNSIVKTEITKLTLDLSPKPIANDNLGHLVNFEKLISRINTCRIIHAEMICYGCIKTLPAQSEILVKTDSSGIQIQRILDVKTSEISNLEMLSIH